MGGGGTAGGGRMVREMSRMDQRAPRVRIKNTFFSNWVFRSVIFVFAARRGDIVRYSHGCCSCGSPFIIPGRRKKLRDFPYPERYPGFYPAE